LAFGGLQRAYSVVLSVLRRHLFYAAPDWDHSGGCFTLIEGIRMEWSNQRFYSLVHSFQSHFQKRNSTLVRLASQMISPLKITYYHNHASVFYQNSALAVGFSKVPMSGRQRLLKYPTIIQVALA
jgi:hypothetical protein